MALVATPVRVNTLDVPEVFLGSQVRAERRQHGNFKQRCMALQSEECDDGNDSPVASSSQALTDLSDIFPGVDASLIQSVVAESSTHQQAVETLLVLSSEHSDSPADEWTHVAARDPGEDFRAFPALTDADGWEVYMPEQIRTDEVAWSDVVKSAATCSHPQRVLRRPKSEALTISLEPPSEIDVVEPDIDGELEYAMSQSRGKHRVLNRVKHQATASIGRSKVPIRGSDSLTEVRPQKQAACVPAWRAFRLEDRL